MRRSCAQMILGGLVGLAVAGGGVTPPVPAQGDKSHEVIRAQRFELVNQKGKLVGQWNAGDTSAFSLWDPNSNSRITMDVQADGTPKLTLQDKDGDAFAILALLNGAHPHLLMGSIGGNSALSYTRLPHGLQILSLMDQNGVTRVKVSLSVDGTPKMVMFDKNKRPIFTAP